MSLDLILFGNGGTFVIILEFLDLLPPIIFSEFL